MRTGALLFVGSVAVVSFTAGSAAAYPERAMQVGLTGGARSFETGLDLETDVAFGLRVGMALHPRVSVLLDYLGTSPARETTGKTAHVSGLRALVQYRLLTGTVRPYAMLGVGGILFDFDDTYDTAEGTLSGGAGVEINVAEQIHLFGEASAEFYRFRNVLYGTTGEELSSSERSTEHVDTFLVGVSASF
jgi:Outer membrane protein beta-barrel domain